MDTVLNIVLQNRSFLKGFLENTSPEDLLKIPNGFKNNILWNIGHIVTVQQQLIYELSGIEMKIDPDFAEQYKRGSFPTAAVSIDEIKNIKELLLSTIEKTKEDYENKIFKHYKEYTTATKVLLKNVEDAMLFNNYHEGIHLGYILALYKAIKV